MPLTYDPDYAKALEPLLSIFEAQPKLNAHDIQGRRERIEGNLKQMKLSEVPDISIETIQIQSHDGAAIDLLRIFPSKSSHGKTVSAYVHAHGGGMIAGSAAMFSSAVAHTVAATGIQFFSVDYRKAPEHTAPSATEDMYAALVWVQLNASRFNINPARIGVTGESAGGGIAAGVAIMARDRKLQPELAKQVLIYPMLDDRNLTPIPDVEHLASWNAEDNLTGWTAYLGEGAGKDHVSPYAAPARVATVEGLPPLYIDVGELDIYKSEDIEYVLRFARANITTELHLYPGLPHGWEAIAPTIPPTVRAVENRIRAWKAI
jgi:acetyl esterase/lipase